MRISTNVRIKIFGIEFCISFLFLFLLCELPGKDFLANKAKLIICIKKKIIYELYLIF